MRCRTSADIHIQLRRTIVSSLREFSNKNERCRNSPLDGPIRPTWRLSGSPARSMTSRPLLLSFLSFSLLLFSIAQCQTAVFQDLFQYIALPQWNTSVIDSGSISICFLCTSYSLDRPSFVPQVLASVCLTHLSPPRASLSLREGIARSTSCPPHRMPHAR